MIGKLKGLIADIIEDVVILDVSGVGYLVTVPYYVLQKNNLGEEITLFIEMVISENNIKLYGYQTYKELQVVRMLTKVKGISNRIANSIISTLNIDCIFMAITEGNAAVMQVPGVGKKLSERIVNELRDDKMLASVSAKKGNGDLHREATEALASLGYSQFDAFEMVRRICSKNENLTVEEIIRFSLKELSPL